MKNTELEKQLAALWLRSMHCGAAINSLAWRRPIPHGLRNGVELIRSVAGMSEAIDEKVMKRRAYLAKKGHSLPA